MTLAYGFIKAKVVSEPVLKQDGAVMVDIGEPEWAAYFAAFNQQMVPTVALGNPLPGAATI